MAKVNFFSVKMKFVFISMGIGFFRWRKINSKFQVLQTWGSAAARPDFAQPNRQTASQPASPILVGTAKKKFGNRVFGQPAKKRLGLFLVFLFWRRQMLIFQS